MVFQNNLLSGVGGQGEDALTVEDSVRFNPADSPYLYRTPTTAGNRVRGSISLWYKRCNLGSIQQLFNAGAGDDITFNASDKLTFTDSSGVSYITTQVFRDPAAWGNLLFAWDTTLATAGDRLRIYHNGTEITAFDTETNPDQNDEFEISNTVRQTIGANESNTEEFDGYLSQFYYVDGQQLTPTSFGETDDNGVWRPIAYTAGSVGSAVTVSNTDNSTNADNLTTYTFSSQALGAADADRKIVVGVDSYAGSATLVSTVTVGGISAEKVQGIRNVSMSTELWQADVPTGTTGDVVVTWASGVLNCAIGVWRVIGGNARPYMAKTSTSNPSVVTVNIPAGGIGIGMASTGSGTATTWTWTNLTEDFEDHIGTGDAYSQQSGASAAFASIQTGLVLTADSTGSDDASLFVIWGPTDTTYGTNGIFLDFADSSDFGNDVSGLGNDYTSSGLAANDQFSDTPTNNACVMSSININALAGQQAILSNGGLVVTGPAAVTYGMFMTNMGIPTSGKYWYKLTLTTATGGATWGICSWQNSGWTNAGGYPSTIQTIPVPDLIAFGYGRDIRHIYDGGSVVYDRAEGGTYTQGDVFELLIDRDAGEVAFLINDSLSITLTGLPATNIMYPFISCYNSNVYTADFGANGSTPSDTDYQNINTANMPTLTVLDGTAYFQPTLYTGDGSTRNIDQTENSTFQPDMVWIKNRAAADLHSLFDAANGVTKYWSPNDYTVAQTTNTDSLTSFDSDGFGLGTGAGGWNDNTENFVAWQWLAGGGAGSSNEDGSINTTTTTVNTTSGVSISVFEGTGSAATVGHGLGVAPKFIIFRNLDSGSYNTSCYHFGIANDAATDYIRLDVTGAAADDSSAFNDTAPTTTVFSVGDASATNKSGSTMVAYAFADVEGFSKFSNYFGNGLSVLTGSGVGTGPVIYTGFKPTFVMIKNITSTGDWVMYDSQRSPYNEIDDQLLANTAAAETTGSEEIDFLSNGFKIHQADSNVNTLNANYVYAAFAQYPFGGDGATPSTTF